MIPFPLDLNPRQRALALKAIAKYGADIIPPSNLPSWHQAYTEYKGRLSLWLNTTRADGKQDTHLIREDKPS
jgi:hypothetical protein